MESNITEFIDIEKFQEKLEELEKKENKKVYEAFLNLAKAQTGNYLLNDKNVSRINTVTPSTVFTFNTAYAKVICQHTIGHTNILV